MKSGVKPGIVCLFVLAMGLAITRGTELRTVAAAGLWYVATTGNDGNDCATPATPCATINAALNKPAFAAGDTVRVASGTYTGTGAEVVLLNKSTSLSGGWDNAFSAQTGMSTLDGQAVRRGVKISSLTAAIERFTIQNGFHVNQGGGIYNSGTATLSNSIITNNVSNWMGGGIFNSGTLIINSTAVADNLGGDPCCSGGGGGAGIHSEGAGSLTLNNSTVSGNKVRGSFNGAGLDLMGTAVINNSTISGNSGGGGEGIYSFMGELALSSSTIVGNQGSGIDMVGARGSGVMMQNTILAYNALAHYGSDCYWQSGYPGTFNSLGYNLVQKNMNCPLAGIDLWNVDPLLGPLQDNGGPTQTHALWLGSPAINAGNSSGCIDNLGHPLNTDQRGSPRLGRCDIGAFEQQPIEGSNKTVDQSSSSRGSRLRYTISLANSGSTDLTGVLVTDTLPAALTYVDQSLTATSGSYGFKSGTLTWSGTLHPSSNVDVTFSAFVNQSAPITGTIVNSAVINGGGEIITRTATTRLSPVVFLPYISALCRTGICGRVTYNGGGAGYIPLELRFYNGSSWTTVIAGSTGYDGAYSLSGAPSLAPGQRYYVRYRNFTDPRYLSMWQTRPLTTYTAGSTVPIGDFDIANIAMLSPTSGATVSLPNTFQWVQRPATPSDSYEFNLYNQNGNPWWWTPRLGYVGTFTLNSLPLNFGPNVWYRWYVAVYSPDEGYGESFYYRTVLFSNAGSPGAASSRESQLPKEFLENDPPRSLQR